jgi:hypothetical protein
MAAWLRPKFTCFLTIRQFHNDGDPGFADDGVRDLNRARCETRAYCALKQSSICDQGYVPQFYGYSLYLKPTAFAPYLDAFQGDAGLPSAILLEYLPHPLLMNCLTYTKERMAKAVDGIRQVHLALVEHNDSYPKNIVIVPGNPERVVWIDFDVAITYPDSTYIGDRERDWIDFETKQVEDFGLMLVGAPTLFPLLYFFAADQFYRKRIRNKVSHRTQSFTRMVASAFRRTCKKRQRG